MHEHFCPVHSLVVFLQGLVGLMQSAKGEAHGKRKTQIARDVLGTLVVYILLFLYSAFWFNTASLGGEKKRTTRRRGGKEVARGLLGMMTAGTNDAASKKKKRPRVTQSSRPVKQAKKNQNKQKKTKQQDYIAKKSRGRCSAATEAKPMQRKSME